MDPFEVHINVNLGLQELNSNSNRDILPEEIDIAVNVAINRFIGSHIKPNNFNPKGFSGTQKDLDDISTLLSSGYLNPLSTTDFQLPANYLHRLSGRASAYETCISDLDKDTLDALERLTFLPFNLSTNVNSPFYNVISLTRAGVNIYSKAIDTPDAAPIKSKEERYLVVNVMLDVLRQKGFKVYWESYRGVRRSGAFIFVDSAVVVYNLTADSSVYIGEAGTNLSLTKYKLLTINLRPAAKLKDDEIGNFPSAFLKTDYDEIMYTLSSDAIQIFPDKSVIVNGFHLNYIRKPRRFSVILNQGIDLPESVHGDIVDLAVEYLSGTISKQNIEWKTQDNQLSVKQI